MPESLFYAEPVVKVIQAIVVASGIRDKEELEDAIGDVVLACIEYVRKTGRPPEDVPEAIAIVRRVGNRDVIDAGRKRRRRGTKNVERTGTPDDYAQPQRPALDPVDEERMMTIIRQTLADDQIEDWIEKAGGAPDAEIAARRGKSPAAVRKQTQRSREKVLGALGAKGYWVAGGFAALLAGMVVLYVGPWRDNGNVTKSPREYAAEQRRFAAKECRERKWDECEKALERAREADPEGEGAPEVKALREAIAAAKGAVGAGDGGGR